MFPYNTFVASYKYNIKLFYTMFTINIIIVFTTSNFTIETTFYLLQQIKPSTQTRSIEECLKKGHTQLTLFECLHISFKILKISKRPTFSLCCRTRMPQSPFLMPPYYCFHYQYRPLSYSALLSSHELNFTHHYRFQHNQCHCFSSLIYQTMHTVVPDKKNASYLSSI